MTAYTSQADGTWEAAGTWTPGGGPPTIGDTATINHNVTIASAITVGTSGVAGTVVIILATGKTLTITSGSLKSRGDVNLNGTGALILSAGTTFTFDGSVSAASYKCVIGSAPATLAQLTCNGTSGSHCTISSLGANGYFTDGGVTMGGSVFARFTDFTGVGLAGTPAILTSPAFNGVFDLQDVTFTNCGQVDQTFAVGADATYNLTRVNFTGGLHATYDLKITCSASKTSGSRVVNTCGFSKFVSFYSPVDFSIDNNYFGNHFDCIAGVWASFTGNFCRLTSATGGGNVYGSMGNNFFYFDGPAYVNPHFFTILDNATISGNIGYFNGSDNTGDFILSGSPASPKTWAITKNINLPNSAGECSGTLFTDLGSNNVTMSATKNICFSGSQGCAVGETFTGYANMVTAFKDNIIYDTVGGRGLKLYDSGTDDAVPDLVASGNADYNCGYQLLAGSNAKGYNHLEFSSGSPGAHDVAANPKFKNASARLATWDAAMGGPGTDAHALSQFALIGSSSAVAAYTPASVVSYIKRAFLPTNIALKGKASDGTTIGLGGFGGTAGLLLMDAG